MATAGSANLNPAFSGVHKDRRRGQSFSASEIRAAKRLLSNVIIDEARNSASVVHLTLAPGDAQALANLRKKFNKMADSIL